MIRKAWICLKLAGPVLAVMHLGGCCLIGAGVGAAGDWDKPDERVFPGYDLADLRTGAEVSVALKSGEIVQGRYRGLEYTPAQDFAETHTLARRQEAASHPLPALGERVQVLAGTYGAPPRGEFAGFAGARRVWLGVAAKGEPARPRLLPMQRIRDSEGRVLLADVLEGLLSEGRLPLPSSMVLRTSQGERLVDVQRIEDVRQRVKKHGALRGFLVGAFFDATIILGVHSWWSSFSGT